VTLYRASADYAKLADSTKAHWSPWLDRIAEHFGELSIAAFDNARVRHSIRQWRNRWAETPRTADMGMQVLSRVCSYAVDSLGKLTINPCEGIKALYASDRAELIWTDADIARIKQANSAEVGHVIDLAAASGLRRGDLIRLAWWHVQEHAIVLPTNKSRRRREAFIPLYDGLRDVLARIPKRSPMILTNLKGQPWTNTAIGGAIGKAKKRAGIDELHFHDLRGTAATRFYVAGLSERVIAEIMGWTEASVANIIRKYVDRSAATRAVIAQLNARPK
jgi:integrase